MKVRCQKSTNSTSTTSGKVYAVLSVKAGWYRIIDNTGEDYLYPPEIFENIEEGPPQ